MRILFAKILLSLCLCASVVIVPLSGCSTSQQTVAYQSLYGIGQSVDTGYKSYLDLVIAGQVRTNRVPQVSRAYSDFQAVFASSLVITRAAGTNSPEVTANVTAAAAKVVDAIRAAKTN